MNVFTRLDKEQLIHLWKMAQEGPDIKMRTKSRKWKQKVVARKRKW